MESSFEWRFRNRGRRKELSPKGSTGGQRRREEGQTKGRETRREDTWNAWGVGVRRTTRDVPREETKTTGKTTKEERGDTQKTKEDSRSQSRTTM